MPENRAALDVFMASLTQWRTSLAGITGLDYRAVDIIARAHSVRIDKRFLEKIRILEHDMLTGLSKEKLSEPTKPCRNAHVCAMCTKACDQRMGQE